MCENGKKVWVCGGKGIGKFLDGASYFELLVTFWYYCKQVQNAGVK